jgi:hypothetical protein
MTKEQEIKSVFENKELIISKKKNEVKRADVVLNVSLNEADDNTNKAVSDLSAEDINVLNAKLVINTTNLIDSHLDCHVPNIWNKSLKEIGTFFLLQEHEMEFDMVIADSVNDGLKAYVENIGWNKLGLKYAGETQALIFETQIKKDRNEFMFNQYRKGYVLNHSVGMRYVKMFLCIDSNEPTYSSEKSNWDKYYPIVANKEVADEKGYFWAVTEAKVIEGSAVVKGSNFATPTLEIEIEENKTENIEAVEDTSKIEPSNDTQENQTPPDEAQKQFFINLLKN